MNQVANKLAVLFGRKIEIEYSKVTRPDVSDMIADIAKVSNEFNWRPSIDINRVLQIIVQDSRN